MHTINGLCGWGKNAFGVLGAGEFYTPVRVNVTNPDGSGLLTTSSINTIVAGGAYVLARLNGASKFVIGWGSSVSSELMYELGRTVDKVVPLMNPAVLYSVDAEPADFKMYTAGRNSIFCYTTAGYKACYGLGNNANGELGTASTVPSAILAPLPSSLLGQDFSSFESMQTRFLSSYSVWSQIAVFAVDLSGNVQGWGDSREGKLGRPVSQNLKSSSAPTNSIKFFAATRYAAAFYGREKLLYTTGANEPAGVLGIGPTVPSEYNIVALTYPLDGRVTGLSSGEGFFVVSLSAFGGSDSLAWWGQVPTNPVRQITVPELITFSTSFTGIYAFSCGRVHCAASTSAGLLSWGFNHNRVCLICSLFLRFLQLTFLFSKSQILPSLSTTPAKQWSSFLCP
jgi:hypothetical protein